MSRNVAPARATFTGLRVGLVAASLPLLSLAAVAAPGCARSPVADDASRSPYERFDDLRGRGVPRTTIDSFGREKLNLEGRLGRPEGDG